MSKTKLSAIVDSAKCAMTKHSPEILTGIGIAGMITTTVLAVKATPQAILLIKAKQEEVYPNSTEKLSTVDIVKTCWKCYVPAVATGTLSIACLVGASSVNARRNAALATAYKLSETALTEYREKVVETIGEKKEQKVRDEVAKDKINKNPVQQQEVIITGKGDTLCYDSTSDRYFKSDIDKLKKVENEINRRMRDEMYISLNEFYTEIGLNEIAIGHDLGWDIDNGYMELDFSSQLATDGTPCLVVSFGTPPRYEFR